MRPSLVARIALRIEQQQQQLCYFELLKDGWQSDNSDVVAQLLVGDRSAMGLADCARFCHRSGAPACPYRFRIC